MLTSVRKALVVLVTSGLAMAVGRLVDHGLGDVSVANMASGTTGLCGFQVLKFGQPPERSSLDGPYALNLQGTIVAAQG